MQIVPALPPPQVQRPVDKYISKKTYVNNYPILSKKAGKYVMFYLNYDIVMYN